MSVTISMPFPPPVNHYWRSTLIGGSVRVLLSKRGRLYRVDVQALILSRYGVLRPLSGRLTVAIVAHPPNRIRRDLDNLLKGPLDALTFAGVWTDDSLLDRITIERGCVKPGGELLVTIEKIPEAQGTLL